MCEPIDQGPTNMEGVPEFDRQVHGHVLRREWGDDIGCGDFGEWMLNRYLDLIEHLDTAAETIAANLEEWMAEGDMACLQAQDDRPYWDHMHAKIREAIHAVFN